METIVIAAGVVLFFVAAIGATSVTSWIARRWQRRRSREVRGSGRQRKRPLVQRMPEEEEEAEPEHS